MTVGGTACRERAAVLSKKSGSCDVSVGGSGRLKELHAAPVRFWA